MARGMLPVLGAALPASPASPASPGAPSAPVEGGATVELAVSGMHCAACVGRVEGALAGTTGVAKARVNLLTNSATVSYDPARVSPGTLVERVAATGYGARVNQTPNDPADQERQDATQRDEYRDYRRKGVASLVAGLIVALNIYLLVQIFTGS